MNLHTMHNSRIAIKSGVDNTAGKIVVIDCICIVVVVVKIVNINSVVEIDIVEISFSHSIRGSIGITDRVVAVVVLLGA